MAGELNNGTLQSINQNVSDIKNSLNGAINAGEGQVASLEGIHEITNPLNIIQSQSESIANDVGEKGWFHDILSELIDWSNEQRDSNKEAKELQDAMLDELSKMTMFDEKADKNTLFENKKRPKVNKGDPKIDDLKELPFAIGTLGSVLVNTLNKKDNKKESGKSIQGFFKGLLEGVAGIAALGVALVVFAGATLLFNFVDWGKAIIGLLSFTIFTIGMVALAKVVGKNTPQFVQFALGSAIMSMSLGVFGISMWIAGNLLAPGEHSIGNFRFEGVGWANVWNALGMFGVYVGGLLLVARLVGTNNASFIQFAVGSLAMAAALGVFAISLWIASAIFTGDGIRIDALGITARIDTDGAIKALGFFGAFIGGMIITAKLLNNTKTDLTNFAKSSMLMAGSMIVFTAALLIASNIWKGFTVFGFTVPAIDTAAALKAVAFFEAFIIGFAAAAKIANSEKGTLTEFALSSMLMSVSLVLFSGALVIASNMYNGTATTIQVGNSAFSIPQINKDNILPALGIFGIFIAGFAALGVAASSAMGSIAALAGISLVMSLSLIAFSAALAISSAMYDESPLSMTVAGKSFTLPQIKLKNAVAALGAMAGFVAAYAAMGAVFLIPVAGQAMLLGIAAITGVLLAISGSLIQFSKALALSSIVMTGGTAEFDGKSYSLPKYDETTTMALFPIMTKFIGYYKDMADSLGVKGALAVAIIAKSVTPLINSMNTMIDVVIKAADNKDKILGIVNGDSNALDHLMDPVLYMLLGVNLDGNGGMMKVANEMDKKGAKVLAIVAKSIGPLVDSMNNMIDVVNKAAKMTADPYPDMKAMVTAATTNLNMIMIGPNGNDGFLNIFVKTAEATEGASKNAMKAIQAMPPLTETLSGLLDVVQKAAQIPFEAVQAGIRGLSAVANFLSTLMETVSNMLPGGIGGKLKSLFTGDPKKQLEEAHKLLQPGGTYYELISDLTGIASKFSGNGFDNLSKIALVGTFTTDILSGSENFKDIMKNISAGVESFKNPSKLENIADAMVKFGEADLSNLDKFATFASKYKDIEMAANAMEKLANSMNKINSKSMVDQLSSSVDKVKNFFGFDKSTAEQTGENAAMNSAQTVTITPGMELQGIAAILSKWDANGVKVYGLEVASPQQAVKVLNV